MEIRIADTCDIVPIAELYIKNHTETYRGLLSEEYFSKLTLDYATEKWSKYLQDKDKLIWVVYEADEFLGFAAGMKDMELENTWYLDSLHVAPDGRGKGIGTILISRMKDYASEKGYSKMSVCIVRGNENAGKLYEKLGAEHFSYFEDDFCGTISHSEKLIWRRIDERSL